MAGPIDIGTGEAPGGGGGGPPDEGTGTTKCGAPGLVGREVVGFAGGRKGEAGTGDPKGGGGTEGGAAGGAMGTSGVSGAA